MVTERELATTRIAMRYDLSPTRNIIGDISGLLAGFCDELIGSFYPRSISKKANVVITELFNNAVEYNVDGNSRIILEVRIEEQRMRVRVMNKVSPEQYEAVKAQVRKIRRAKDLRQLLAETIRERRQKQLSGGLGLIRLAAESKFSLSVRYRIPFLIVESHIGLGGLS